MTIRGKLSLGDFLVLFGSGVLLGFILGLATCWRALDCAICNWLR